MATLDESTKALERMQGFDPNTLVREEELGRAKTFSEVVSPAQRLIDLYKRLSTAALQDFPDQTLQQVRERANGDYNLFDQVLNFNPDRTKAERDNLISQIRQTYGQTFNTLHPLIAYSLHRSADFQRLDAEARSTIQGIKDQAQELTKDLKKDKDDAARILAEVRATAAETGVSQQALYFKQAADEHDIYAREWRKLIVRLAWATGAFALASLFIHKLPFLAPASTYDTVQIAVSKILVFAVLSFMLYLAARNFLSHNHNSIVNRHRQHALLTYKAIVDAAGNTPNREVVLSHAAACIFSPQPTGYTTDSREGAPSAKSVVELLGGTVTKSQ